MQGALLMKNFMTIDNRTIEFNGEKNLLEVIRKAKIELPTFCYHSELSVYGACRLCLVDVEGRGLVSSCSVAPEAGLNIKTNTAEIREIRKIAIELLLANHDQSCPTCSKSSSCKLLAISRKTGVDKIRFKKTKSNYPVDLSSTALIRDPSKCILCGDCVRACSEIQGIGAIDFAYRGSKAAALPAFGKKLAQVECVDCGQCARVCPTGAITPKFEIDKVLDVLEDGNKIVIAQIAPAVRTALGEMFDMKPGVLLTGQIVAALKILGFSNVFDTSFAADLTVIEEANEFISRKTENKNLPMFTSCCPAWVRCAEQYYPEILNNISSCKSPQQMFGAIAKKTLPDQLKTKRENIVVVSIMPCTAKKFEASRPEFTEDGTPEVDFVLTTQELAEMIKGAGICFEDLAPESMDMPLGFKTGAGVIFGASGGVSEAVLRYAHEKITGNILANVDFLETRGDKGIKEIQAEFNGDAIRIAIVQGLKNAKKVVGEILSGVKRYDLVEVMACPSGCVGGAGQPVSFDSETKKLRAKGLYDTDKTLQLHKSQENPYVAELYSNLLKEPNSKIAHEFLHTKYNNRKRIMDEGIKIIASKKENKLEISVCVGTNCYLKGSQNLLHKLIKYVENRELKDEIEVKATFCMENCHCGPSSMVGDNLISESSFEKIVNVIEFELNKIKSSEKTF